MIRAYLDEIARLKSPVRLWIAGSQGVPFETTLEKVSPIAFSTTTTPKLDQGQILAFSFMLDGHRFTCSARVVSPGVFKIPLSIVRGERRAQYRVPFERDRVSVFAVESLADTVLGGRTLLGRLVDLSPQGLRVVLEDVGTLGSGAPAPKAGDCYSQVCLQGLPLTPAILCRGVVVHLAPDAEEPYAGLRLEGLAEVDRKHLDRLLTPRVPASFGEHFPHRKRKTDFADRLGAPTSSRRRAKAPEMVDRVLEGAPPPPPPEAPPVSPAMRLRKASKKVLFLSTHPETPIMAESLRQDGFKQVFEARSYQEARILAERVRFDLVILDLRVGGHWGRDIMTTLASQGLLIQVPIILMVDYRNDAVVALAMEIGAATIHERHRTGDMLPVVHGLLLG
jgi:CheY-like chemotaxis protein